MGFPRFCEYCRSEKDSDTFRPKRRKCGDCEKAQQLVARNKKRQSPEGLEAHRVASRKSYHKNKRNRPKQVRDPLENKDSFLRSTYGITYEEFIQKCNEQGDVCKICKSPETRKSRYGGICRLHVDHEHTTGKVRGLLCHACNSGLGHFREDIDLLWNAIEYIEFYKKGN